MRLKIVDTTLRDGEQQPGLALGIEEKVRIARILNDTGIDQIEAGIPAMGGEEKRSVAAIAALGLKSRVSAWNRMSLEDLRHSLDCGVDLIHISVPVSNIQLRYKLGRDEVWVLETMKRCLDFCRGREKEVTVGLEDASRAQPEFLFRVITEALSFGVKRFRYADTVGIAHRSRITADVTGMIQKHGIEVEMHAHNDFGMAVSNSIAAANAGAAYIDCTAGGIGERAGNCALAQFVSTAADCLGCFDSERVEQVSEGQKAILRIIFP